MALIEFRGVSKTYRLGEVSVAALKTISFQINQGEFVALSGPSGSGKSTLCNLIGAVDRPNTGVVCINQKDLNQLSDDTLSEHRNRSIGFIFQNFNLINVLTALENVMLPLQLRAIGTKEAQQQAQQLLESLRLSQHIHHRPDQLSGGQRQRVAIARALVTRPPIIVADEPTANLDTENSDRILDMMEHYNQAWGTTFILSTHDPRLLKRVSRNIHLRDGAIVDDCSTSAN
jgi:putative ABC transport system ATP-binding protein